MNHPKTLFKKLLKISTLLFLSFLLMHTLFITIDGLTDENAPADVAVVFGNKVDENGQLSERLKSRLDKTIELYNEGQFQTIIVSGGIDSYGNDEAEIMKTYLLESDIPETNILVDSKGNTTADTVLNTAEIMQSNKLDSVFAISQFYHISRIKLAFSKAGIDTVSSAHSDYYELRDFYSLVREFFAYYKYLLAFPTPNPAL